MLVAHSLYFRDIIASLKTDKKFYRILLPKWVTEKAFLSFLNFLETECVGKVDLKTAQQLLWIGDFFRVEQFMDVVLNEVVKKNMEIAVVMDYFSDCLKKLSRKKCTQKHWIDLFEH